MNNHIILGLIKKLENIILVILLIVFSLILVLALVDIIYELFCEIINPPFLIIKAERLIDMFSIFLVVLIGLELLETIKAYLKEDVLHVELVILLAIIAISRKVIVWNFDKLSNKEFTSLAIMIVALSLSYFLLKLKRPRFKKKEKALNVSE
jgi:uncharacterized membrane protein (DUF373 family)